VWPLPLKLRSGALPALNARQGTSLNSCVVRTFSALVVHSFTESTSFSTQASLVDPAVPIMCSRTPSLSLFFQLVGAAVALELLSARLGCNALVCSEGVGVFHCDCLDRSAWGFADICLVVIVSSIVKSLLICLHATARVGGHCVEGRSQRSSN